MFGRLSSLNDSTFYSIFAKETCFKGSLPITFTSLYEWMTAFFLKGVWRKSKGGFHSELVILRLHGDQSYDSCVIADVYVHAGVCRTHMPRQRLSSRELPSMCVWQLSGTGVSIPKPCVSQTPLRCGYSSRALCLCQVSLTHTATAVTQQERSRGIFREDKWRCFCLFFQTQYIMLITAIAIFFITFCLEKQCGKRCTNTFKLPCRYLIPAT